MTRARASRLPAAALLLCLALAGCAHQKPALATSAAPTPRGADPGSAKAPTAAAPAPAAAAPAGADSFDDDFGSPAAPVVEVSDPLAPWNRAMFVFNDKLYFWVIKPVARGYRAVVPRLARTGVENFFHNLGTPLRLVSDLLRLKPREASIELGSFMINSTWGVLGFGNLFAGNPEAKTPDGDIGLALATHGVPGGPYVVWPFLGPSTLRDSVGLLGDFALDPITYVHPLAADLAIRSYSTVNAASFRIGDYETLKDAAIDPYVGVRDAYLQHRAAKAKE